MLTNFSIVFNITSNLTSDEEEDSSLIYTFLLVLIFSFLARKLVSTLMKLFCMDYIVAGFISFNSKENSTLNALG